MSSRQSIFLSFFPLDNQEFQIVAYRRQGHPAEKRAENPGLSKHSLPIDTTSDDSDAERDDYWVSLEFHDDLDKVVCSPHHNRNLTYQYLYTLLAKRCSHSLQCHEYLLPERESFRNRRIEFIMQSHKEGNQVVWLEPYFLVKKRQFGFLVDFDFSAPPFTRSNRTLQRLSLGLDSRNHSNRNFYADRYAFVRSFAARYGEKVFALSDDINVLPQRCILESTLLKNKQYVFGDGQSNSSQFIGLLRGKPIAEVKEQTNVRFFFLERDRWLSRNLYSALSGSSHREKFPGMTEMFGIDFSTKTVSGTAVAQFDVEHVTRAIDVAKQEYGKSRFLPVVVSPFDKNGTDETNELYYTIKHFCLRRQLASQFVSVPLLSQEGVFKFAISNIGLQMFAKMGGEPWTVRPETPNCLVVGIGQAHRRKEQSIEKYFAYSILTEASGKYKRLKILSSTKHLHKYENDLSENLRSVLREYGHPYTTIVLHTSFRLKRRELAIISRVLESMTSETNNAKTFVVMKFNDKNKFFAYSSAHNSMTPYESTSLRLSQSEYLVWFKGLQYNNRTLARRIERPMHVEFLYSNVSLTDQARRGYLQDALNISGANWRGFNAKSLPVSMFYAYLVAQFYKGFQVHNLEEIDFETIRPWFL